ncbi:MULTISPECIES: hypothetical protein [Thermomonosporaceae]|uniref:hypothetical protein n=1 Tax=Thermomonosporaceae TaxID=2012 RepID=UPI00255AC931|nr:MULTISPECIES: hypothetical protein [Thermomonosporaceae]MDL4772700.1 hypothetical protein [Actinomadura xylanilytica]
MAEDRDRPTTHHPGSTPEHGPGSTAASPPAQSTPAQSTPAARRRRPTAAGAAAARRRAARVLATAVSVVTTVVVLVLAVHIVFVAFEANTANDLVRWTGDRATDLAWQFKDVFQPRDHKVEVAVNHGLAAVVYLVAGRILVGLIRRLG